MAKPIMLATAGDKIPYANGGLKLSKTILLDKINLHPDFQKLFDIEPELLDRITQSIKENGFDNSQPLHLWVHDGNYDLIDGYTRYAALKAAGKDTAPYFEHNFDTFDEAYKYVLSLQVNRRNLSGAELLRHVSILTGVTNNEFGEGKKSKAIAEALGVSTRTVEKALAVEKKADEETKEKINSGEMSVNQAYNKIKNKEKREKISQATEDDLNDLPFTDSELGNDTPDSPYSGDAFDVFGDEDDDEDNSEVRGGIDLASLISDCMKIAERYDLEVEEDGCKTSPLDDRIIYSVCIKFSLAGKVINPQIYL